MRILGRVPRRRHYVVAYDVGDARVRRRVVEVLRGTGRRVGLSVFEITVTAAELRLLEGRLRELIDSRTDRVLVYGCCRRCRGASLQIGMRWAGMHVCDAE